MSLKSSPIGSASGFAASCAGLFGGPSLWRSFIIPRHFSFVNTFFRFFQKIFRPRISCVFSTNETRYIDDGAPAARLRPYSGGRSGRDFDHDPYHLRLPGARRRRADRIHIIYMCGAVMQLSLDSGGRVKYDSFRDRSQSIKGEVLWPCRVKRAPKRSR